MDSLRNFGSAVSRNLKNLSGWKSNRKIIVIESDDWGSIRVPSRKVFEQFVGRGFNVAYSQYNRLDGLESNSDLECLFEVLRKHSSTDGNHPRITANVIMANPDFNKIRNADFQEYHYEHFRETLKRYPQHDRVFSLYQEGIDGSLFHPQFHGREHLQVNRWMRDLRTGREDIRFTFDEQTTYSGKDDYNYMEALDMDQPGERGRLEEILRDGLNMFHETFGYRSRSFIAPCYTWDGALEQVLSREGVEFLQGGMHQYVPQGGFDNYVAKRHYLGSRNTLGQIYLTRNCFFEPSLVSKSDWVDYTLASIRDAFRWHKPAIICSHRINFIGYIEETNRTANLKLLDELLRRIVATWADVEFMTSDQLGSLIKFDEV